MTEKQTLQQRLINAQVELKAPKGQFNSFGKYKYRSAEDILEAVKPVNQKHGLLLTLSDDIEIIGDRVYISATASVTDGENEIKVKAYAREPLNKKGMDDSQITGTASSYARKYALNGLYLIDDTKDADTDEHHNQTNKDNFKHNQDKAHLTDPTRAEYLTKVVEMKAEIVEASKGKTTGGQINQALLRKFNLSKVADLDTVDQAQMIGALKELLIHYKKQAS